MFVPIFYSFLIGLIAGYLFRAQKSKKDSRKNVAKLYQETILCFDSKIYYEALSLISEAKALSENLGNHNVTRQIYNAQGHIFTAMGQHRFAAEAFWKAIGFQWGESGILLEDIPYYYYRCADSFMRDRNFEFALIRANDGVAYLKKYTELRHLDNLDLESKLREIRIFSSLNFYKGSEAFEKAAEDAEWVINNSKDEKGINLAKAYLNCFKEIRPIWEEEPPRRLGDFRQN